MVAKCKIFLPHANLLFELLAGQLETHVKPISFCMRNIFTFFIFLSQVIYYGPLGRGVSNWVIQN